MKMNKKQCVLTSQVVLLSVLGVTLSGCKITNSHSNTAVDLDTPLSALIVKENLSGDPSVGRNLPLITEAKPLLGKKVFFTKILGGNNDSACVTCHHPVLGGGDNLSLPIGVNATVPDLLGPGRLHDQAKATADNNSLFDGGPTVPRNAPTTFNIGMWDQALFHDGRVESLGKSAGFNGGDGLGIRTPDSTFGVADPLAGATLASAQSRFPVTSPEEMRGFANLVAGHNAADRTAIEGKMAATWGAEFAAVFGDNAVTYDRIADVIGEYERSQVFIDTPWKSYVEGNTAAISDSAKRGAVNFFTSTSDGGAGCASCHSGDFFTDEQYHVLAIPQIGRGKGDANGTLVTDDFGRMRETKDSNDKYKFRTPTLLNVEVTGPYGHGGAYATLEGVVEHMLNPSVAVAKYDTTQLDSTVQTQDMSVNTQFALNQLGINRINSVSSVHRDVAYTTDDITDLVAFLKTLTDPCVKSRSCLAPWIPSAADTDPDGLRINAVNANGDLL